MAEQARETKVRSDKKSQHDIEPGIAELGAKATIRSQPPGGLWRAVGANSVEAQAARLSNKRLQSAQRRILASHIGHVQGNHHLQKVMASLRREAESQDSAEDLGCIGISDPPTVAAAKPPPSGKADLHRIPTGNGNPLPPKHRAAFEQVLNHPLDHVRIHTGAEVDRMARQISAEAFTVGSNIYFRDGVYVPGTTPGDRVLGHELTHVVQNDQGCVPNTVSREFAISQPTDDLEKEAYAHESMIAQNVEGFRAERATPSHYTSAKRLESNDPATDEEAGEASPRVDQFLAAVPQEPPPSNAIRTAQPHATANSNPVRAFHKGLVLWRTASSPGEASPLPAPGVDMPPSAVPIPGLTSVPGSQGAAVTEPTSRPAPSAGPVAKAGDSGITTTQGAAGSDSAAMTATSPAGTNGVRPVGGPARPPGSPQLETSSSEVLLESLTETPASLFGAAVGMVQSATSPIQAQEKADLEAHFPEVEQPTGLPVRTERTEPPAIVLVPDPAPTQQLASGSPAGAASETTSGVAAGSLPANQVSTAASEPAEDEGGSWWDWLFNRVSNFVASLPTSDPALSTSAGQRPRVDLSGEANPAQNAEYHQASDAEVAARQVEADVVTTGDFGEQDLYPTVPTEKLWPAFKPSTPSGARGGVAMHPPELPEATRTEFDQGASPLLRAKVQEQVAKHRQDQGAYQKQSQPARDEGEKRIAEETAQARAEQEGLRAQD